MNYETVPHDLNESCVIQAQHCILAVSAVGLRIRESPLKRTE